MATSLTSRLREITLKKKGMSGDGSGSVSPPEQPIHPVQPPKGITLKSPAALIPPLEPIPEGDEIELSSGVFLLLEREIRGVDQAFSADFSSAPPLRNLTLIRGIGPITRSRLEDEGYNNLDALACHPKWCTPALEILRAIKACDVKMLSQAGCTDAELMYFFNGRDLVFLDIETTGLSGMMPLFLVGIMLLSDGVPVIRQYLARGFEEEAALLERLAQDLKGVRCFVTFNGKAFDIPYINSRFIYHGIRSRLDQAHIDLLKHARRLYKGKFENCRLSTLEARVLNSPRSTDDIPGSEIPEVYHEYTRTGDFELIRPIIEHNALDLRAMALLLDMVDESHRIQEIGG